MSAMNCEVLAASAFAENMKFELEEPMADMAAGFEGYRSARFALKGFDAATPRSTLTVRSNAAGGLIYKGPFHSEFSVSVPERLFRGKGRDSFRVMLSDPDLRRICVAEQSGSYWRQGGLVTIELLPHRELDRNGLPVAFRVVAAP